MKAARGLGRAGAALVLIVAARDGHGDVRARERVVSVSVPEGEVPEGAESIRVLREDETIVTSPSAAASRRGSARLEAKLPIYASRTGTGCKSPYWQVGPAAWVCGDHVDLSRATPIPPTQSSTFDGLPFRYYFVGPNGTSGYRKLLEVDLGEPDFNFDPGFAVAIVEERSAQGERYGKTGNQLWVPMRDLGVARPLAFSGVEIDAKSAGQDAAATKDGGIPHAWVIAKTARVYASAGGAAPTSEALPEFTRVDFLEESGTFEKYVRIAEKKWIRSKEVRHPSVAEPPPEIDVASAERWIDIDLETQTLVAYEGTTPVFATLVSSGKGRQGTANATPKGTYRIWVKLESANMDNLENENANRYYRMENVPYVQYFEKGVGIHGAFWHRSFGRVRSHGCVNVAPKDAERLFGFTSPRLPAGWSAVLPRATEQGTVVRVR